MRNSGIAPFAVLLSLLLGCEGRTAPSQDPASRPSTAASSSASTEPAASMPAEVDPILPASHTWTRDEALARLVSGNAAERATTSSPATGAASTPATLAPKPVRRERSSVAPPPIADAPEVDWVRVSAAVRLLRLAEIDSISVPSPLAPREARRLRVHCLGSTLWAVGRLGRNESELASPVLLDTTSGARVLVEGIEEELSVLAISHDADVFPHLLIAPTRVLIVGTETLPAIVAIALPGLRFSVERQGEYPYIALLLRRPASLPASQPASAASQVAASQPVAQAEPADSESSESDRARKPAALGEVARYTWDPYERGFMGPAKDKLPDPLGGVFEIDLKESKAFIPVGGEIAEPKPPAEQPQPKQEEPPPS